MRKLLPLLLFFILMVGCTTTRESFKYGGMEEDFSNGVTVFYQLEISFTQKMKNNEGEVKEVTVVKPMPIGKKINLPKTTNGLVLGLYIKNTKDVNYEVWEHYEVFYNKNTEPYYIKRRLEKSRLPDMVQSINLPRQNGSEVVYKVEVVSDGGVNLFTIGDVKYSVGVN